MIHVRHTGRSGGQKTKLSSLRRNCYEFQKKCCWLHIKNLLHINPTQRSSLPATPHAKTNEVRTQKHSLAIICGPLSGKEWLIIGVVGLFSAVYLIFLSR